MAFVKEVVPEEDKEFWLSMKLKNCWGDDLHPFIKSRNWCADRNKNAYLMGIGGGCMIYLFFMIYGGMEL